MNVFVIRVQSGKVLGVASGLQVGEFGCFS